MDTFVDDGYLGMFFCHVEKTDTICIVNQNLITNRIIYIENTVSSGYVTLVLNSKLQILENFITPCRVILCFWPINFRKCHPFQFIRSPYN